METKEHEYSKFILKFKRTPGANLRFIPSLFTFDAFDLASAYDKVLYLDADMIVLSNISELFELTCEIAVTPDAGEYDLSKKYSKFNGGFLMIDGSVRHKDYKKKLIDAAMTLNRMEYADQSVMNSALRGKVTYLTSQYNCLKRCFPDNKFNQYSDSIKIIHYVGAKPWHSTKKDPEKKYTKIENIWKKYATLLESEHILPRKAEPASSYKKILILTSSFDGDLSPFLGEDFTIFSTNWGICHGIKIDYYFCSADDPALISELNRRSDIIDTLVVTNNIKKKLSKLFESKKKENIFDFLKKNISFAKNHILPKSERGNVNLPTSGVQMICAAANFPITELFIRGVNLYSLKNSNGGYKLYGTTQFENPYILSTKPHDLRTDIFLIYLAFKKLIEKSVNIDCDSDVLNELFECVKNKIPVQQTYELLIKKFYNNVKL
jgi:lipopolysaccharide biosynthesis glycosyltransferase